LLKKGPPPKKQQRIKVGDLPGVASKPLEAEAATPLNPPAPKKAIKAKPLAKPAVSSAARQPAPTKALPASSALAAAASTTVPYLQSDGTNRLFPMGAGLAMMSTDGVAVLLVTADGSVSFASLATGATLWSPLVQAGQAPGQLELTADGELRLITMGKVLWKAGTAGRAKGPARLTAKGQDLALQDLASNRTIWLAPVGCSAFGAAQLQPLAQCGGLSPVAQAQAAAVTQLADAPWANTCCPTAHQCSTSSSGKWLCQPSGVLDSCIGPRTRPVSELCGGTNLCGEDAACRTSCCSEGNYCQRLNAYTWSCAPLANFAGGLL
jgi:hypothetical protein